MAIEVWENVENDNNDSIYLKKTFEICIGKKQLLECLKRHCEDINKFIEEKL